MAELVTWCRIFRIGPVYAKPCDDCRRTSRVNALVQQSGEEGVTLAEAYRQHGITPPDDSAAVAS